MTGAEWAATGTLGFAILQWGLIPHLLSQKTKTPNATLAWLWAILLFPIAGGLFYVLVGSERVQRRHLRRARSIDERMRKKSRQPWPDCGILCELPELRHINGFAPTGGNACEILPDGTAFFPLLLDAIANAKDHLHVEFYIWNNDRTGIAVRDALTAAARRGVTVRIMLDEMGSLATFRSFFAPVIAAGGKFSWFHTFAPLRGRLHLNLRNHRKLLIADGHTAFTGGLNVGDEYWTGGDGHPPYRDVGLRLRGPAVAQLAEVFAQDWHFATDEELLDDRYYPPIPESLGETEAGIVPGGPDNELNEIQLTTLAMIQKATHRIQLMTPYFVPEGALLSALQLAAMRGVEVTLIVPEFCDHVYLTHVTRGYYDDLLPYGIRVFEYLPRMLHAKVTLIDGRISSCGSANLDVRSLRINFELNVVLAGGSACHALESLFQSCLHESRRVTPEAYAARRFHHRFLEVICRPLASLL